MQSQTEGNQGLKHTSAFIERNSWMKNYIPQAAGNQFNATASVMLHSKSAIDVNNYVDPQQ